MAEITRITSEALQATIRRLLPSQQGFGDDLQATNLITPIIDLTPTAEGSVLRADLQEAAFFNQTFAQQYSSGTTTLVNTTGFWLVHYIMHSEGVAGSSVGTALRMNNGLSTANLQILKNSNTTPVVVNGSIYVYIDTGESIELFCDTTDNYISATCRQVADKQGNLVNPTGFSSQ